MIPSAAAKDAASQPRATAAPMKEKRRAALSSVIAAVALTSFKLVVGLLTNSLGILSEAAHSGFDLGAALITLWAVRVSDKPADELHLYGHGKVENLSAMVEALLLLITCVWIIYEAVERLFFRFSRVDASLWAFLVMSASIVVDYSRSRLLFRVSRKFRSQALEADALHFSTDIWSSAVVILGLLGVALGEYFPRWRVLEKMDAAAALMVAVIVIVVSLRLGKRTVLALMDTAPPGLREKIKVVVESLPDVHDCHKIRVRSSGSSLFVDVHVLLDGSLSLEQAHNLTEKIEQLIQELAPEADITVHPEPCLTPSP